MEELQNLTPLDLKPEFTAESLSKLLKPLRSRDKQQIIFTTVHRRKDGTLYPVEVHLQLMAGEPPVFAAIILDITERKQMEERLNLALEATVDGVWDWNISTGHVFFSPQWFRSLGYEPGELEPHVSSWEKLVHPADMPKLRKPLNAHLEGKISFFQFENRLRAKSGKYRWYLGRGQVVSRDPSGKPLRMVGTDTDITERKQAEQALGKAIRDMQLILDSAGEGIYGLDLEGRVTFINPVAAHMLGFHLHDELIGKKCALFCTIPKPMALYPEEECSIHKSIKDGNIYHVTDGVFWKKDGTSFPVEYY